MRGRSKAECNVWTVLTKDGCVGISRNFILRSHPTVVALLCFLYAITSHEGAFVISDELAECLGWKPWKFIAARRQLVKDGYLDVVRRASRKKAQIYRWV